ncbi:transposase [Leptospira mayottensis]|uniref:transposase n=2 Tax=Leptospira mayottensis TaxID=1137606 RepID=UPI003B8470E3
MLTDGNGIPLAITLTGANVHDKHGVKDTLNSILIFSGKRRKKPKHLCLDKGYDFQDIEVLIKRRNIQSHIRKKGEKPLIGKYNRSYGKEFFEMGFLQTEERVDD